MTPKLKRTLKFLRITDDTGNLSLTNLALVAALVNMTYCGNMATPDLMMFIATIVGYQVKRFAGVPTEQSPQEIADLQAMVKAMETKITALQIGKMMKPK